MLVVLLSYLAADCVIRSDNTLSVIKASDFPYTLCRDCDATQPNVVVAAVHVVITWRGSG